MLATESIQVTMGHAIVGKQLIIQQMTEVSQSAGRRVKGVDQNQMVTEEGELIITTPATTTGEAVKMELEVTVGVEKMEVGAGVEMWAEAVEAVAVAAVMI
jgi:hypothetical protein